MAEIKRIYLLLISITISLSTLCQTSKHFTGTVKNADGQNIEYVTVVVKDMDIRTITDAHGNFSVVVPDNNSPKLVFSHVAYSSKTVDIKGMSDKSHLDVIMEPSAYTLTDFTVVGKKIKEKTLKHKGLPFPGDVVFRGRNNIGVEMGITVKPKHDFHVKNIYLPVHKSTYSKCTLSVNVYEIFNKDSLVNILHKPIYSVVEESQAKHTLEITPQEPLVFTNHKGYYVSIEIVDTQSDGAIYLPAYFKTSYVRDPDSSKVKKIPINLGLSIKGFEY
jgi:hypothetical protein